VFKLRSPHLGAKTCDCGVQLRLQDSHAGDPAEWPAELRVREWPPSLLDGGRAALHPAARAVAWEPVSKKGVRLKRGARGRPPRANLAYQPRAEPGLR
jgi:hypothetical protein